VATMTDNVQRTDSRLDLLVKYGRDRQAQHIAPGQIVRMYNDSRPYAMRVIHWEIGTNTVTGRKIVRIYGHAVDEPVTDDSVIDWTQAPADEPILSLSKRDAKRVGLVPA
jgi:hypothetical protein